jgi:hypothetical protein
MMLDKTAHGNPKFTVIKYRRMRWAGQVRKGGRSSRVASTEKPEEKTRLGKASQTGR